MSERFLLQACNPAGAHQLANTETELSSVNKVLGGLDGWTSNAFFGGSCAKLVERLRTIKPTVLHFIGHGNVPLDEIQMQDAGGGDNSNQKSEQRFSRLTLAFVDDDGTMEVVTPEAIVDALRPFAFGNGGCLRLVFLNACETTAMGKQICEAGVPFVFCWETECLDRPAKELAMLFYQSLLAKPLRSRAVDWQHGPQSAFEAAKQSLLLSNTRVGTLGPGTVIKVQLYDFGKPQLMSRGQTCIRVGIPQLIAHQSQGNIRAAVAASTATQNFQTRLGLEEQIDSALRSAQAVRMCVTLVLVGMPGTGKTSLARQFVETQVCGGRFKFMWWIDCSSHETLCTGLSQLANFIQHSQPDATVYQALAEKFDSRWLVVFDGLEADSAGEIGENLLPSMSLTQGSILVTSRSVHPHFANTNQIHVGAFQPAEAQTHLIRVTNEDFGSASTVETSTRIATQLCNLPAALSLAEVVLVTLRLTLSAFEDLLSANYVRDPNPISAFQCLENAIDRLKNVDNPLWTTTRNNLHALTAAYDGMAVQHDVLVKPLAQSNNFSRRFRISTTTDNITLFVSKEIPNWSRLRIRLEVLHNGNSELFAPGDAIPSDFCNQEVVVSGVTLDNHTGQAVFGAIGRQSLAIHFLASVVVFELVSTGGPLFATTPQLLKLPTDAPWCVVAAIDNIPLLNSFLQLHISDVNNPTVRKTVSHFDVLEATLVRNKLMVMEQPCLAVVTTQETLGCVFPQNATITLAIREKVSEPIKIHCINGETSRVSPMWKLSNVGSGYLKLDILDVSQDFLPNLTFAFMHKPGITSPSRVVRENCRHGDDVFVEEVSGRTLYIGRLAVWLPMEGRSVKHHEALRVILRGNPACHLQFVRKHFVAVCTKQQFAKITVKLEPQSRVRQVELELQTQDLGRWELENLIPYIKFSAKLTAPNHHQIFEALTTGSDVPVEGGIGPSTLEVSEFALNRVVSTVKLTELVSRVAVAIKVPVPVTFVAE